MKANFVLATTLLVAIPGGPDARSVPAGAAIAAADASTELTGFRKRTSRVTGSAASQANERRAVLLDPDHPEWSTPAPDRFRARFTTSKGEFVVEVHREWAPLGADRFYNLSRLGYYDDTRFYRIRAGEFVQFGLSGDPAINAVWYEHTIPDDPPLQQHTRGRVFFAMRGPDDRTTQAVINLTDHPEYYGQGFVPFGEVIEGMDVVDSLYSGYGESAGGGMRGGNQGLIVTEGNAHLDAEFPLLDELIRAVIE
jgi:cyclophilin family peptidyl-prolyl cis-trans isomerase